MNLSMICGRSLVVFVVHSVNKNWPQQYIAEIQSNLVVSNSEATRKYSSYPKFDLSEIDVNVNFLVDTTRFECIV